MADDKRNRNAPTAPVVIGIVGGIGSGKSTVAGMLEEMGCALFDADASARLLLDDPIIQKAIIERWGVALLGEGQRIDRAALGRIVFADAASRKWLEERVHPRVREFMNNAIQEAHENGFPAIALDIPLLMEGGLDSICDAVLFVDAPETNRTANVKSRGWDAQERNRRESVQASIESKRDRAEYRIVNDSDLSALRGHVVQALSEILAAGRDSSIAPPM